MPPASQLTRQVLSVCSLVAGLMFPSLSSAQSDPFATGWLLQPDESRLSLQSVKTTAKGAVVLELSSFANFVGGIGEDGAASLKVYVDSIDTKVDLRNVRMRFLLLESFKYPEAVVSVQLDPAALAPLATARRLTLALPYRLDLHGVHMDGTADVDVTLMSDDAVVVASSSPIPVQMADFNLSEGVVKLEEAAGVKLVPTGFISFDLVFRRIGSSGAVAVSEPAVKTVDEPTGTMTGEACVGRFEILSRSGNINFSSGSARLDVAGSALLSDLVDIIRRCPTLRLEVGGHTDSDGDDATNLVLSERRAASVIDYLTNQGLPAERFELRGYGEANPIVPNDSAENKRRNRRIEFTVIGQ